ncbi:MAG TPA: efflux RND transporter periplasmic adaptor subunit [Myxococcota bacterium]
MNRIWIGALLVAAAVAIGVLTVVRQGGQPGEAVRVALVEKHGITQKVLAQGKVKARTQVEVASEIGGRVNVVNVKIGDTVKVGDPLFALDDEQLKNAVEQLRVARVGADALEKRAELALAEAQRGIERDRGLKDKGVVADEQLKLGQSRLDLAKADVDSAKASIERADLDLQRARDALRRARVTAPAAGTVVAVGVEVGQVVSAVQGLAMGDTSSLLGQAASSGPSAPVVIADLSALIVKLDVDELDVGAVKVGQSAVIHAQGIKDLAFTGTVERVGLMGRDQAGAVLFAVDVGVHDTIADVKRDKHGASADAGPAGDVGAESGHATGPLPDSRDILRPGMSAQADIEVQHIDDALVVPVAAVLEGDGVDKPDRVFVYDGNDSAGTVKETTVKLGPTEGDSVAIASGLSLGEKVVDGPFRALKSLEDKARVTIEKNSKADDKGGKK